jgi:hypothetical protein
MNDDSSFNVMSSSQFMLGSIPVPDLFFSLITVTETSHLVPRLLPPCKIYALMHWTLFPIKPGQKRLF